MYMSNVRFSPFLLEESYKYYRAAKILKEEVNLLGVAEINAALSIEIALKSFLVIPAKFEGTPYEEYVYKKPKSSPSGHKLCCLYSQLPCEVKEAVFTNRLVDWIVQFSDTFTRARYRYEPSSHKSSSDVIIEVAFELLKRITCYYLENDIVLPRNLQSLAQ